MLDSLVPALLQLGLFAVVLGSLQWCFPNQPEQKVLRTQWRTDLAFYFGQHLVWLSLQLAGLVALKSLIGGEILPESAQRWFSSQSFLVQAAIIVACGDLCTYWYHRLSHQSALLWQFHRVHHSAPHLDWLAAHREHPIDGFLTQMAMNFGALLLDVSLTGLAGLIVFRGLWATFIHSNVRLPLGPLRVLVGAPELHHWHHVVTERTEHNFSNLAPWTDVLFGTYHCPDDQRFAVGLPGTPARSYLGWLIRPQESADGATTETPQAAAHGGPEVVAETQ